MELKLLKEITEEKSGFWSIHLEPFVNVFRSSMWRPLSNDVLKRATEFRCSTKYRQVDNSNSPK